MLAPRIIVYGPQYGQPFVFSQETGSILVGELKALICLQRTIQRLGIAEDDLLLCHCAVGTNQQLFIGDEMEDGVSFVLSEGCRLRVYAEFKSEQQKLSTAIA